MIEPESTSNAPIWIQTVASHFSSGWAVPHVLTGVLMDCSTTLIRSSSLIIRNSLRQQYWSFQMISVTFGPVQFVRNFIQTVRTVWLMYWSLPRDVLPDTFNLDRSRRRVHRPVFLSFRVLTRSGQIYIFYALFLHISYQFSLTKNSISM